MQRRNLLKVPVIGAFTLPIYLKCHSHGFPFLRYHKFILGDLQTLMFDNFAILKM